MQRQDLCAAPSQPQGHLRVALLPYVPYTRKVLIHNGKRVQRIGSSSSVGEHVLRRRSENGLTRQDLSAQLGVDESTLMNWELGRTKTVPAGAMPAVIQFLGYNPEPEPDPEHIGARLKWKRRSLGLTAREAARRNSVDPSTWECWESQKEWPRYPRYRDFLIGFLETPNDLAAECVRKVCPAGARRSKVADA